MTENGEYFNVVVIPSDQVPENYQMGNVIFSPKRGKFISLCFVVEFWNIFLDETKMEFMPSPLSAAAPLTPPASVGKYLFLGCWQVQISLFSSKFLAPVSPEQSPDTEERLSRKRCQNKQSSKRYRQKIKNKEQALFDAVGDLNKVSFFLHLVVLVFFGFSFSFLSKPVKIIIIWSVSLDFRFEWIWSDW